MVGRLEQQSARNATVKDPDCAEIVEENTGGRKLSKQSERMLIQVLNAIPNDLLQTISPQSAQLKKYSKVPMLLLVCEASIQVGLDLMCFKFAQILLEDGYFPEYWWQTALLFLAGCILAVSNLHFINLAVKYYDATDVVPALSAATMIAEIFAGLIVGGEFHLYNFWELFWIFMSTLICIAGIQVLVMKTS